MSVATLEPVLTETETIIYPESDGQPMANNTKQFNWIVTIKENLEIIHKDDPDVFVAGDLLWYPVQGKNTIRLASDILVAFGRPKGHRGSYLQWKENDVAPQVVFEILSPGNTRSEMRKKFAFYERYGVQEYYLYDPDRGELSGWLQRDGSLNPIKSMRGWISPWLNVKFDLVGLDLRLYGPDGQPFLTVLELAEARQLAENRAAQADHARLLAENRARKVEAQLAQVLTQLRALGIDPKLDGNELAE